VTAFLPGVPVVKNSELPARGESLRDHIARFVIQNLRCFGFVFRERDLASSLTYIGFQDQRKRKTEIPLSHSDPCFPPTGPRTESRREYRAADKGRRV